MNFFLRLLLLVFIVWVLWLNLNYFFWTSFFRQFFEKFGFLLFLLSLLTGIVVIVRERLLTGKIVTINNILACVLLLLIAPWLPDLLSMLFSYFDPPNYAHRERIMYLNTSIIYLIIASITLYLFKIQYIPNLLLFTNRNILARFVKYLSYLFLVLFSFSILSLSLSSTFGYLRTPSCEYLNRSLSEEASDLYFQLSSFLSSMAFIIAVSWMLILVISLSLIIFLWRKEEDIFTKKILLYKYLLPIVILNIFYIPTLIFIFLLI